eukprot:5686251-Prymnesium_polylepis.1
MSRRHGCSSARQHAVPASTAHKKAAIGALVRTRTSAATNSAAQRSALPTASVAHAVVRLV